MPLWLDATEAAKEEERIYGTIQRLNPGKLPMLYYKKFFGGFKSGKIFFACEKREVITRLADAFENPVYAITLGNSDEIAKICSIEIFEEISCEKKKILTNTWLPGDYSRKLKVDWEKVKKAKISLTLKPPIVKKLPCDFEFDANGVRKAVNIWT